MFSRNKEKTSLLSHQENGRTEMQLNDRIKSTPLLYMPWSTKLDIYHLFLSQHSCRLYCYMHNSHLSETKALKISTEPCHVSEYIQDNNFSPEHLFCFWKHQKSFSQQLFLLSCGQLLSRQCRRPAGKQGQVSTVLTPAHRAQACLEPQCAQQCPGSRGDRSYTEERELRPRSHSAQETKWGSCGCSACSREGSWETLELLPVPERAPRELQRYFGQGPGETTHVGRASHC